MMRSMSRIRSWVSDFGPAVSPGSRQFATGAEGRRSASETGGMHATRARSRLILDSVLTLHSQGQRTGRTRIHRLPNEFIAATGQGGCRISFSIDCYQGRHSRDGQSLRRCYYGVLRHLNSTRWGGTVGVGFEYGFTPNWSFGAEYDHLSWATTTIHSRSSTQFSWACKTGSIRMWTWWSRSG